VKTTSFDEERAWKEGRQKGDPVLEAAVEAANVANRAFLDAVRGPGKKMGSTFAAFRDELQRYLLAQEVTEWGCSARGEPREPSPQGGQ